MDRLDPEVGAEVGVGSAQVAEAQPRFGASHALLAFGLLLFGQLGVGAGLMLLRMIVEIARGADPNDPTFANEVTAQLLVPMIVGSATISILVVILALRLWAWHLVRDRSSSGLGFFVPPLRQLLLWSLAGIVISAGYLALTTIVPTQWKGGPLAKVATSGGLGRATWAILALLFAPLFEEILFRGLMLRGLMTSWGVAAAGTIVTVLFFAIHLFEAAGYWPAMMSILVMSLVTLSARLRTGSVVTAIAVHGAYNAVIVVAVYAAALR